MDKNMRLPSDSNPGSCHSGATHTLQFQNCSSPSYRVVHNNNTGRPSPGLSTSPYSQFLPPTTTSHSLPPPPGLPHPGLSNIYQFPPHCPPSNYQSIHYNQNPDMPGASANSVRLAGHFPCSNIPTTGVKSSCGQYNGLNIQNGGLPTYHGYPYFDHVPQHVNTVLQDGSVNINKQSPCGPYSKPSYNQGTYQQMPNVNDFNERLHLLTGCKNSSNSYEEVHGLSSDFLQNMKSPVMPETNMNESNSPAANFQKTSVSEVENVMNPIVENFVGSMTMSNGTYTHFGPTVGAMALNGQIDSTSDIGLNATTNTQFEVIQKTFSNVAVTPVRQQDSDSDLNSPDSMKEAVRPILQQNEQIFDGEVNPLASILLNPGTVPDVLQQRSSSPKDPESNSRPQTPGKPSYLEVLTKAAIKNQISNTGQKASSTSSSPVQSAFSGSSEGSQPTLTHRKSVDIFMGSASSPSSSCPSTSSSPATKQRNSIGVNSKGKENVSNNNVKRHSGSGFDRTSPSVSPSHQQVQNQNIHPKKLNSGSNSTGDERKILSSQNNSASKSGKTAKSGKPSIEKSSSAEDVKDEGDWGWKTYTSRSRNNNVNIVGNKNSQKRLSSNEQSSADLGTNNMKALDDEEDDEDDVDDLEEVKKRNGSEDIIQGKKSGFSSFSSLGGAGGSSHMRKQREKSKNNRREGRHYSTRRRLESWAKQWIGRLISFGCWLWTLVVDVAGLSASLGVALMHDFYSWTKTKALPNVNGALIRWRNSILHTCQDFWGNGYAKITAFFSKEGKPEPENNGSPGPGFDKNILSLLGPERNIALPANGDEALKRLLSVKGQDPYSILGVRSDSSDETIRRYYKRQAVLVHPDKNLIVGAEEAFKILARAFELVGDPIKRTEYHQKLMEAQAKEKFCGEIGNLLEQLRRKMEAASSTIRCTKCNSRHKKNITGRPLFAARYCSQCRIHHGAREGELWAERKGWFGLAWNYYACMDGHIWEINEWAKCQKHNLKHIKADAHCVMYRLVAGGNNHNQNHNPSQHCHGNNASFEDGAGSEADEWDSLINNLYKSPGSGYGKTNGTSSKPGCCGSSSVNNNGTNAGGSQTASKRRKGKRTK